MRLIDIEMDNPDDQPDHQSLRDGDKKKKKKKNSNTSSPHDNKDTDDDGDGGHEVIKSDREMKKMLEKQDSFSAFLSETLATTVQDTTKKQQQQQRKEVVVAPHNDPAHHSTTTTNTTTSTATYKRQQQQRVLENSIEVEDENLGEDFDQTPWLPPMIEKAKEFKRKAIYHGGDVRLDGISLADAPDLGAGVSLYFLFAKVMAVCFLVMVSLACLPAWDE